MDTSKFAKRSDISNLKSEIRGWRKELDTKLDKLQNTLDGFAGSTSHKGASI